MLKKLKEKLHTYCHNWVDEKVELAQNNLSQFQLSANEETKSSAGDKYETGRAMAQLEIEKASIQLAEAYKLKRLLSDINIKGVSEKVILGSLVCANEEWFFISISAGRIDFDDYSVICVSPVSPIGRLLLGLQVGESFKFNQLEYTIKEII